jgi:ABC-type multidrug transport system permease subunit
MKQFGAMLVTVLGLVGIVLGGVFIGIAFQKEAWMRDAAAQEKVTVGLTEEQIANGDVVDRQAEMQAAADIIRDHRRSIAPTYNDLLAQAGGRYDPTNAQHLSYSQALNMENYLYLGVLGYGVTLLTKGIGAALIVFGVAFVVAGFLLFRRTKTAAA